MYKSTKLNQKLQLINSFLVKKREIRLTRIFELRGFVGNAETAYLGNRLYRLDLKQMSKPFGTGLIFITNKLRTISKQEITKKYCLEILEVFCTLKTNNSEFLIECTR